MDAILLNHIYKSHPLLNDISITVKYGEIYGIVGKQSTSLLKIILGQSYYNQGQVRILESNQNKSLSRNRKRIGYAINTHFFKSLNASKNLYYYCLIKGIYDKKEVEHVLQLVGLQDNHLLYRDFSHDMKNRLAIAKALLGHPAILLLDEPMKDLNDKEISSMRQLLFTLNKQGVTILLSSHCINHLNGLVTHLCIIEYGCIKEIKEGNL